MKFSIRYADQIVGALIILALAMLIFVIFMLGSSQRWFSRDYTFVSYFPSASGLSQHMAVQYKGFTIGHVKSIKLTEDDQVEVRFTIFDTYISRVRNGSVVEVTISPIGSLGGSQFLFYPGTGTDLLSEGSVVPIVNSAEGKRLMEIGLAQVSERNDNVANIISSVGSTIANLNNLIVDIQEALAGTDRTSLGRTMGGVESAVTGLQGMTEKLPGDIEDAISGIMLQVEPILINLRTLSAELADPDGAIVSMLDAEGDVYQDVVKSVEALSGTLRNLETTTKFIPSQLPQVAVVINDLHGALRVFEDVLVSLTNNPLLKKGIPERTETKNDGTRTRDLEF